MVEISKNNKYSILGNVWAQYLIIFVLTGILYTYTCAPTVLWQDSGLLVYRIWHNDLQGNLGIALAHPVYIMLGIVAKVIPVGELAWRINMLSVVFGVITVANLFLLLRLWLGRLLPAIIGSVTLAVSWTFWQNAVIAEVYSLYTAQLSVELLMLFQYVRTKRVGYLYWLGLLNGLAIANHLWGLLPLFCYGVLLIFLVVRRQISLKNLGIFVLLWILGAVPYEYLIVKNIIKSGDVLGTLSSAVFGDGWQSPVLNVSISLKIALENIIFILLNFPTPNLLLLFFGLWVLWRKSPSRSFANIVFGTAALFFVFAFRYTVVDRHAFFLPFYFLAALFVGLGADWFCERYSKRAILVAVLIFAFIPVPSYFAASEFARKYYKPLGQRRQRPYRDEYTYWLRPWKTNYRGAERFAREVLEGVDENAVIYAYPTDAHPLLYEQEVKGQRPDVKVVSDYDSSKDAPVLNAETAEKLINSPALYVISNREGYCPPFLLEKYDFIKSGVLYKVVARK